jgi:aspartyl-tRNA(Asn)/glutamyl-tRNA(Gln) amidotransferase subunit A
MFNLTGLPTISIPCGYSPETNETPALPISLQLTARPWDEARLLQAAFAYEQATRWHEQHPELE